MSMCVYVHVYSGIHQFYIMHLKVNLKLDDMKVLKCSPDLLNSVKISQGQLRLIILTYFVLLYMGMVAILVK